MHVESSGARQLAAKHRIPRRAAEVFELFTRGWTAWARAQSKWAWLNPPAGVVDEDVRVYRRTLAVLVDRKLIEEVGIYAGRGRLVDVNCLVYMNWRMRL